MKTHLFKTILAGLVLSCVAPAMQLTVRADDPSSPSSTDNGVPGTPGTPGNPTLSGTTDIPRASDTQKAGQFSASDYKFARKAAEGGMMEVKLGEIASQKSNDPEIKKFGERMVQDHSKAGKELEQIATQKGATLPTEPGRMHQRHIDHLSRLNGSEFDKAYVAMMLKDHKADLKEFKEAAESIQDADLKAFASRTSTVVEDHLKAIQEIDRTMRTKLSSN